jgi:2-polyprenyl-3-methyl-5-hydroxy-6-metoxy-1,4-benzoquinol methylase
MFVQTPAKSAEQLSNRIIQSLSGFFDIATIHLGNQLGYYKALYQQGPLTATQLAQYTQTHHRYAQEWLEQQAIAGFIGVVDETLPAQQRRFFLYDEYHDVLANPDSLDYIVPVAQLAIGAIGPINSVIEAYRTGEGVAYEQYGKNLWQGQGQMNRMMFLEELGKSWLPAITDVHERLRQPGACVADIGCGVGYSSIGIARYYSQVSVDGYDLDRESIEEARRNAQQYNLEDRVTFHCHNAGDLATTKHYDLVIALECLHDMSNPVETLMVMKHLAGDSGCVLVVDERVSETFTCQPAQDSVDWMMYGWSVLHCLPVGLAHQPSAATGTVMRPATLKNYALSAGFSEMEILPIDHYFFQFYRLRV